MNILFFKGKYFYSVSLRPLKVRGLFLVYQTAWLLFYSNSLKIRSWFVTASLVIWLHACYFNNLHDNLCKN